MVQFFVNHWSYEQLQCSVVVNGSIVMTIWNYALWPSNLSKPWEIKNNTCYQDLIFPETKWYSTSADLFIKSFWDDLCNALGFGKLWSIIYFLAVTCQTHFILGIFYMLGSRYAVI